jgi:hypothetical protein
MIKISKQKFLFATAFLIVLAISGICASTVPIAHAAALSTQDESTTMLKNVLGININSYKVQLNSQIDNQFEGLSQSQVDFSLISNQSSVRVSSAFVTNTLRLLYLSDYQGALAKTQPAGNTGNMAKDFLVKYQAYVGDSFYGMLATTLDTITGSTNATKSTGNVTLKVLNSEQSKSVDYVWTYIDSNGIVAQSKDVVLSFDQGRLKCFLNNWPLYKVADTPTISKAEAISLALAAAKNFTYQVNTGKVNQTVSLAGFQVSPLSINRATLSYVSNPNESLARGDNPFNLYPAWYVPLGFKKFYPGDVTGVSVVIWADNGKIGPMNTMAIDPEIANSTIQISTANGLGTNSEASLTSIAIGTIVCTIGLFVRRKKVACLAGHKRFLNQPFWAILLSLVAVSGLLISTANAWTYSSRIYGSLYGGGSPPSPPQTEPEREAYYCLSGQMFSYFEANGHFDTSDYCPTKDQVLSDIVWDEAYYDRAMIFQFGHEAGAGNGYVDSFGNPIWASDISPRTQAGKYDFVFLWVCNQAKYGPGNSITQAWFPNSNLCPYGYGSSVTGPDSEKCFIGFYGESPEIGSYGNFLEQWTYPLEYFIQTFYYYAVIDGYSITDSLNQASLMFFSEPFSSSVLYNGYNMWWPGGMAPPLDHSGWYPEDFDPSEPLNHMEIFGDGAMTFLQQYLTVYCDPNQGYTQPSSSWQSYGSNIQVVAWQQLGYYFDHWIVDGYQTVYDNPITISMNQDHTLQPVYTQTPTYYTLTINTLDYFGNGAVDANIYVDGNYVGIGYASVPVTQGIHNLYCDDWAWSWDYGYDVMFMQYSAGGSNGQWYNIGSSTYLTGWYYP